MRCATRDENLEAAGDLAPLCCCRCSLVGLVFASLVIGYTEQNSLRPLAESYVRLVPHELGAPNVITGILLTYRGFDTLGEVAVLFMVAASVGLVLGTRRARRRTSTKDRPDEIRPSSEIVRTGAEILVPLICIFAAYIIMNGHLSAGGGFQGGAVIASGVLLTLLAFPQYQPNLEFLSIAEWSPARSSCLPESRGLSCQHPERHNRSGRCHFRQADAERPTGHA